MRLGHQWVVAPPVLEQFENLRLRRPGRPLGSRSCWEKIRAVEEGALRVHPANMDVFRRQVRNRSLSKQVFVHHSMALELSLNPAVVLGGADAAIAAGTPLDDPRVRDLYVRCADLDTLISGAFARAEIGGNVVVHAVTDVAWPFAPDEKHTGLLVAWLDLADRLERGADLLADRLIGGRVRA